MKNRSLITGFISALCLTSSCCLFGSENSDNDIDSILSSSPTTNQPKVIFPSGGYRAEEGADAFITADFLYWEARQEGLSYAMTGVSRASSGSTRLPQGNIFYPEFKYDPGFRVGLGIGLGHDAWSLSVQYTWYHQNFHPASVSHPNNSIAQLTSTESNVYTTLPPTPPFTYAKGEWKLMLNMIDGELGRDSYVSKYLAIDTFYGLKAVWQNQNFNTIYQWNDDNNRNTPTQNNIYQSAKSFGIGLRAGAHTVWSFNRNWSLFGDFAANVLSTRSHILAQNKQFVIANSSSVTYFQNIEKKISYIQPLLEMLLGIGWDMWMQDDEYHLGIKIGWEEQMWFGNNNYILGSLSGGNADMSIQGFVFKARFDF